MKRVNIRESLLEIDRATDCQYDLTSLYEACKLDDEDKKKMVQYIEAHEEPAEMGKFLATKCEGLTEKLGDDDVVDIDKFLSELNDGEGHSLYALEDKADKLNEDTNWRTNPSNRKEVRKYVYSKISPFDELTDDNSRYWDFDRAIDEGDEAVLVKAAPRSAKYLFSLLADGVNIDIYLGRGDVDTWYVVDNNPELEESAIAGVAMALGTAAATGFGQGLGDKVGAKLMGEDADDDEPEYVSDFSDGEVEPGMTFFADGYDWKWIRRIGDVVHLDFDNWAVWMAFRPEDENNPEGPNVVQFFIVDEDTGFIDWGPVDTMQEAQEFLQSKVNDWEMDESLTEEANPADLKTKLETAAREFIINNLGYDDDFVNDYIFVDVTKDQFTDGSEAIKCEIRTELDYEECEQLANALNPIVAAEDKHAYFDMETSNILVSYLRTDFSDDVVDEAAVAEFAPVIEAITTMERLREVYRDIRETLADVWTSATLDAVHDLIMAKADELNSVNEAVATMERPAKKDLTSIDGTIASVLNAHKEEIDACGMNMNAIKSCVTKILTSGEVKGDAAAQKAVMIINNCRNLSQLLSTLTGYMTGMNAITNRRTSSRKRDVSASLTTEAVEDDNEDKPYTYRQVYDELKLETRNFTVESDSGRYGYESEAQHAVKILEKHYASVELDKVGSWFQVDFKDRLKKGKKVNEASEPDVFSSMKTAAQSETIENIVYDSDYTDYINLVYEDAVEALTSEFDNLEIEPSVQAGRGGVFASYDIEGERYEVNWDFEQECADIIELILDSDSEEQFKNNLIGYLRGHLENAQPSENESDGDDNLSESKVIKEEWNREWDNIGIEIEKAARAQHIGVDFINTDSSVMGAFTATFEINRGDWKHDHWAFDEVVKEYLADNEKYALWKIDTNQIGSSDDDSYSAEHIAFIVPKDKMELLNSMKGLFAESVNPADLTDCPECGDVSFDSKRGRCTKCNYREELVESYRGDELTELLDWLQTYNDGELWDSFVVEFEDVEDDMLEPEDILSWLSSYDEDAYDALMSSELYESKSIEESFPRNIDLDQVVIQVANLVDDKALGDDWIEVFPTRDASQSAGGEYFIPLEITGPEDITKKATFRTRNGRIEVAFSNGSEAMCDSAESIARFIAGEFGLGLGGETPLLNYMPEEELQEGRMTDRYKAQVKQHFEAEIDSTDISHEIAEDGLSFTIVRADGTKLEFNAAEGYTTTKPEELKEEIATYLYLFPELTDEDLQMAKAYGLQYLGKNHGADGSEDNWVVAGSENSLTKFAERWLGYELHPDYLYDADDFAGDIDQE